MKAFATFLPILALAAFPVAAQPPNAPPANVPRGPSPIPLYEDTRTLLGTPELYGSADVLAMFRRAPTGPLLVNQYTGETVVDFRDEIRGRWAAGTNLTLGYRCYGSWNAEATYFGLYGFDAVGITQANRATPVIVDPTNPNRLIAAEILPFPGFRTLAGAPAVTFDPRDVQNYQFKSTFNSVEVNARNDATDRFSVLFGVRYLNLAESLEADLFSVFRTGAQRYMIETRNNLVGVQVGADYNAQICDPFYLRIGGRMGVLGNAAQQTTEAGFLNPITGQGASRSGSHGQASFLAQASLNAVYEITPRIHAKLGYNLLLVTGVASAPSQTTASNFAPGGGSGGINTRDSFFAQGLNLGIEYHR